MSFLYVRYPALHSNIQWQKCCIALLIWIGGFTSFTHAAPHIVVTIAPLHSIVASVTGDVIEPRLLVPGNMSPHAIALRPSQARMLANADMIIRIGPQLELFLEASLRASSRSVVLVNAMELPDITLHEIRVEALKSGSEHGNSHENHNHFADDGDMHDPHIWLDPDNAGLIAQGIASQLASIDPDNAVAYLENADAFILQMKDLEQELSVLLNPVKSEPFFVFHDSWQYFESRFGLTQAGAVSLSPEKMPGAAHLVKLRDHIGETGARCLFSEPQFSAKMVRVLALDTSITTAVIDPLGADLVPGPDMYARMMRNNARILTDCLSAR
ncbi:MAG: zinc ABC transporter substrate-binding protein [Hyphomicrobiales bacterium]|nr:MAG: zinc ABC transporter substrate-binding protein [Hyphomicrobiales bacterium]